MLAESVGLSRAPLVLDLMSNLIRSEAVEALERVQCSCPMLVLELDILWTQRFSPMRHANNRAQVWNSLDKKGRHVIVFLFFFVCVRADPDPTI